MLSIGLVDAEEHWNKAKRPEISVFQYSTEEKPTDGYGFLAGAFATVVTLFAVPHLFSERLPETQSIERSVDGQTIQTYQPISALEQDR